MNRERGAPRSGDRSERLRRCANIGLVWVLGAMLSFAACASAAEPAASQPAAPHAAPGAQGVVPLPAPQVRGAISVEQAIAARRSVRDVAPGPVTLAQLAQLLWAAQGVTAADEGLRAAPSAGALYPLEVYVAAQRVEGVAPGVYRYLAREHALQRVLDQPVNARLAQDALGQGAIERAPLTIIIAAVVARTSAKYGERGRRYVQLEAGHAAQNLQLQAVALGLASVVIGAFDDARVRRTVALRADEEPLSLVAVGRLPGS